MGDVVEQDGWAVGEARNQIELATHRERYQRRVYTLPKHLDEKVAALHLGQIGARLTRLTRKQAAYIGVPPDGPFKPDSYRY